jgi:hypothetical protein
LPMAALDGRPEGGRTRLGRSGEFEDAGERLRTGHWRKRCPPNGVVFTMLSQTRRPRPRHGPHQKSLMAFARCQRSGMMERITSTVHSESFERVLNIVLKPKGRS